MKIIASPQETDQQPQNMTPLLPTSRNAKHRATQQTLLLNGGRIVLLACILLVWQLLSGSVVDPLFISSPSAVASQASTWISDGTLWMHTSITLEEILLGLLFGIISGIVLGFLLGVERMLARLLDPFIVAIYSIPKVALAPLLILWFGIDIQMKIILAAVTVFFLVFFNTLTGVRNVDQDLIDAVLLMGGKRRDILFKVIIPSATGSVLTGVHIAIPYALIGAVIAELIASNRGIGYLIDASATSFNTAGVFVGLVVLTLIASILNAVVNFIDRKTSRWKVDISIDRKVFP